MILIWNYQSKKEKVLLIVVYLLILMQVIFETVLPSKMGEITKLIQSQQLIFRHIMVLALEMLLFALLAFLVSLLAERLLASLCGSVCKTLRKAIFEKIMGFSNVETDYYGTGSLITRATEDITTINTFIASCIRPMVQAPLCALVVLLRMSGGHIIWSTMGVVAIAAIFLFAIAISIIAIPVISKISILKDKFSNKIIEHMSGIRVIHAYNAYKKQKSEYEDLNNALVKYSVIQEKATASLMPFIMTLLYGISISIYFSGAFIIKNSGMDMRLPLYSNMVTYTSYITLIVVAFVNLIIAIFMLPSSMNAAKRIAEVLNREISIKDSHNTVMVDKEKSDTMVEFKNVSFRYHDSKDYALKNISFDVKKGKTLAIIGSIGCGKSTLLNLIPRLLEASEGEILIAGQDIKNYRIKDLRNLMGFVPQKSFLFSGSIFDNISYGDNGKAKANMDDAVKAAKCGMAHEFIMEKEGGYSADVLMGGSNFSGGQRQRLTIARALCKDPEILIFDDSFSALDFKTDKEVRKNIKQMAKDKAVIIVGHRIGSIMDADRILVMNDGRIVGQGTHKELMKTCDVYKEITLSQLSEKEAM